ILSAGWLATPLDIRSREFRGMARKQKRLVGEYRSGLLASRDNQGCLIPEGGKYVAQCMTYSHRGVQVDQCGLPPSLRESICHADDDTFVEAEHVTKIRRKVAEHRQLG